MLFGVVVEIGLGVHVSNVVADDELLQQAAVRFDLDADVLRKLLALEEDFPDFTVHGSKTDFTRRVAVILDGAAGEGPRA